MKTLHRFAPVAAVGAAALLLASCGSRPDDTAGSAEGSGGGDAFKACMVLDTGGVDDRSFNQSSYAGMEAAKAENPNIEISYVPSADDTQYTPNLQAQVQAGCDTIIGVGGLMADSMKEVASANPDQSFAEIDSSSEEANVYALQYNTAEAAFLGGYLAAGMTKTGVVGTWGGLPIPPVTIFMDGFWEGVQHHNQQKGTNVRVLGWDENNPGGGTFANSFQDQAAGRSITETLAGQGADVIMPVAGQAGLGAGAAAEAAGGNLNLVWVDTDGCESAEQYCKYFISSVTKNLTDSVKEYVLAAADGEAPTGSYVGTLENEGVGLAPFNQFDAQVPAELKSELEAVRAGIVDGSIEITSPSAIAAS
ncbi:BMP family lipoprotein [Kineococcus radiotolerans]|uniref:Basic membrane lipoprotein n=1 Tax=Kineococcus radiotolerans (strain ATCC BAA-149 / DSM 14245 / SRS30216) TaxID=266940 RepID=A6WF23_KINRD|nr:BMP family ABC transporter substrate-binding protein [Kineococcus radiotolerans]ABS05412.1 basic membrane lipoprotein [Kineococcus radiotolerans SRS30216 = ATCC BAA-149]